MEQIKKIGFLTTINHNIGDDFIRYGIINLLSQFSNLNKSKFVFINKHKPYQVLSRTNLFHYNHFLKGNIRTQIASIVDMNKYATRFDDCGLIIQCGTPVFYPRCSESEWANPIWEHAIKRNVNRAKIMNLAAGSCFPWETGYKDNLNEQDILYIKNIVSYAGLTTVRDKTALSLLNEKVTEADIKLLPCTAFLSGIKYKKINSHQKVKILINFMEGGGHYDWNQGIDGDEWKRTILAFYKKNYERFEISFIAHNKREYNLAKTLFPSANVFYTRKVHEYFEFVKSFDIGILNRLHASVALASLGIPSISIGTDTRLEMVSQLGLPVFYVKEIEIQRLENIVYDILDRIKYEQDRLIELRDATYKEYIDLIKNFLF